jgi:hypothetical protein
MDTLEVIDLYLCAPVLYSKAKDFLTQDSLQVRIRRADGFGLESLHQRVEHCGRKERRKAGPEANIFYPEVEKSQKDRHGLLLIPG